MAEQRRYRDRQSDRDNEGDRDRYGRGSDEWGRGSEQRFGGEGYGQGGYGQGGYGSDMGREQGGRGSYRQESSGYQDYGYGYGQGGPGQGSRGGYGGAQDYRGIGGAQGGGYIQARYGYGGQGGQAGNYENRGGYGDQERGQRNMWDRATDEVSSWFGDRNAEQRREMDQHRGRGPKNYKRSDARIHEDVCDRLGDDGMVDASEIEVKVSGGEVTLSGTVKSRDQRRRAEDCAESVSGVGHVQNNVRVKNESQQTGAGSSVGTGQGAAGSSMSGTSGTTGTSTTGTSGATSASDRYSRS
ncbi:MAG: BON domain-containing protein [Hyphomicrobiaceae bacterium]